MKKKQKKTLSVFLLAMMNVAIVLSLRGLPLMAKEGSSLVFYLVFSLIIFLIPTALVSAELASGWPEEGGVFRWVTEAFGEKTGFTAIWLQWMQNIFWYPTILAFAAGALAYLFFTPELAANPLYNIAVILVIYWGSTLINLRGMKASGWLASSGVILGTILPAIFIIGLGILWWLSGKPLEFISNSKSFIPDFSNFSNLSLLAGIILLFAGMEVNAVHVHDVKNPKRSFPKAIFLAVGIIFIIFFLGSLSVAAVVPEEEISLTAGIMQAFAELLKLFHMHWLLPVVGLLLAYGTIGGVAAWIVGPSKGIFATSKLGLIPPFLSRTNKAKVPASILIVQGIIVSFISLIYLVEPTVSSAFFLLTDLTVILYLIMYILLFAAAIHLRYKRPKVQRSYKIPGGNFGMWLIAGIGILGALFAIFVGFFPPSQLTFTHPQFYISFLGIGVILALVLPQIIYGMRKPSWKRKAKEIHHVK
ncbi:MAG: Glutamate/gamma-aminobutyrate antiporter [Chlamydiae bacterium]|nr:Glutamate/gamma-aminobutyrate antiporter [Chlamydiota bacterium]